MSGQEHHQPQPQQPPQPFYTPLPPILPRLGSKVISVGISREESQSFRFMSSDTKQDIYEEISKAFNLVRFSLRDGERNIVTGSWESLTDRQHYDIIDRGELPTAVKKGKKRVGRSGHTSQGSEDATESDSYDSRVKRAKTQQSQQVSDFSTNIQVVTPRTPQTEISEENDQKVLSAVNQAIDQNEGPSVQTVSGPVDRTSSGSTKIKRIFSNFTRQGKACSRCRKGKKGCDRERPCGRCVKANKADECDAGN